VVAPGLNIHLPFGAASRLTLSAAQHRVDSQNEWEQRETIYTALGLALTYYPYRKERVSIGYSVGYMNWVEERRASAVDISYGPTGEYTSSSSRVGFPIGVTAELELTPQVALAISANTQLLSLINWIASEIRFGGDESLMLLFSVGVTLNPARILQRDRP